MRRQYIFVGDNCVLLQNLHRLERQIRETPPKQVRLTELRVSRCLRRSLLPSSVRNKASSHSESPVIMMRVFPAVNAEARSCGQDRLFCLRCCANVSKP